MNNVVLRNKTDSDFPQARAVGKRHSSDSHLTGCGRIDPAERVEQSRFPLARTAENADKFAGGDVHRELVQNGSTAGHNRQVSGRDRTGTFGMNEPERVSGKLKNVAGDAEAISEDQAFAGKRHTVKLHAPPTLVGNDVILTFGFDESMNPRNGCLLTIEIDPARVRGALWITATNGERLIRERNAIEGLAAARRAGQQALKFKKCAG